MLKPPLAITACELLTPLDGPHAGTWESIRAGRRVGKYNAVANEFLTGEESLDRSLRLALAVAQKALAETLSQPPALFCGTSKGPVGIMLEACARLQRGAPIPPEYARQVALGVGAMGTILRERLALNTGEGGVTSVAACSSGMHALHRAAQALWRNECSRALVVAADASLHPLFEAAFKRLGVLAPAGAQGVRHCAPFDQKGAGFFLSEAAVALILERAPAACSAPLAYLEESWIGGDATGLVAVDEHAATLRHGLDACLPPHPDKPAFVHAHATGTRHDAIELAAIRAVCGTEVEVFSHKKWLGHSLGAAGLVGVGLSALCHRHRQSLAGRPLAAAQPSLTIAQGFGGHIAIVRLRGA